MGGLEEDSCSRVGSHSSILHLLSGSQQNIVQAFPQLCGTKEVIIPNQKPKTALCSNPHPWANVALPNPAASPSLNKILTGT